MDHVEPQENGPEREGNRPEREGDDPQRKAPLAIRVAWVQLLLEATVGLAAGVLLLRIAEVLPAHRPDGAFLLAVVLLLHASAALRFFQRASDFFELECPHCAESFHGLPDRLPLPFRTRCAHCGAPA